jgi:hypothetical protein
MMRKLIYGKRKIQFYIKNKQIKKNNIFRSFGAIAVDMLSLKMSEISISKKLPVEYISVINR